MESQNLYRRLTALAVRRYGLSWNALRKILRDVLLMVWCVNTSRPEFADKWSPEKSHVGQDDVTSYFLACHIFGGDILMYRLPTGPARYAVWQANGEGTTVEDFCGNWEEGIRSFEVGLTPEELLQSLRLQHEGMSDPKIDARLRLFEDRFESSLRRLEEQ